MGEYVRRTEVESETIRWLVVVVMEMMAIFMVTLKMTLLDAAGS